MHQEYLQVRLNFSITLFYICWLPSFHGKGSGSNPLYPIAEFVFGDPDFISGFVNSQFVVINQESFLIMFGLFRIVSFRFTKGGPLK